MNSPLTLIEHIILLDWIYTQPELNVHYEYNDKENRFVLK